MPLVDMKDLLMHAYRHRYAVGAFDLVSLDFLEAIMAAAEARDAPVILSLAESHFEYYDFELAMAATVAAARRARVPVAIHLDHGASTESAVRGINLGCNGVMVDASQKPFDGNVAITKSVVDIAHACGVPVEGELGYVAGVEGDDAEKHPGDIVFTSPEQAQAYVQRTGIDFLAVSIGTVHGRLRGVPRLDIERLACINALLGMPLVIHGGTGLADEQYRALIDNGVVKINYYTALADAAATQMRANVECDTHAGYAGLMKGVRDAIQAEVERMIELFGSACRAAPVLAACRRADPVAHVVLFNAGDRDEKTVGAIMARGQEQLARIPGVMHVGAGWAIQGDARYRGCWIIEFTHPDTIATYREHPIHVEFADTVFRPVAADRLTIDYHMTDYVTRRART